MPAVQLITALPAFVSQEEHASITASTPNSFGDIPSVIKHREENVTVILDPPLPDLTESDLKGTLYVLTSALVFFSSTGRGFQVEYPSITLHAVSRGESGPSIYCQLDESGVEQNATEGEQEFSDMRELSVIPGSPESLERIFEALSHCASLHPDGDVEDDDEFDEAFVDPSTTTFETFTGGEDEELSEVGRAALAHLESVIYNPFEDAEDQSADVPEQSYPGSKNSEEVRKGS